MKEELKQSLQAFFGPGNEVSWDRIKNDPDISKHISPWIERLERGEPSILPRRIGSHLYWYGVAFSERQMRQLGSELKAFVGLTKSTFQGRPVQLNPSDGVEAALIPLTGGSAYIIKASEDRGESRDVWQSLLMLKELWDAKPLFKQEQLKPVGRILGDFYMALQAGNRQAANEALQVLKTYQLLETLNISFLQVHLLESFAAWEEIMDLPAWPELVQVRRPLLVTRALVTALYHRELAPFEAEGDFRGAADHFAASIYPRYQNLFRFMASLRTPELLKCFMFAAVKGNPPQPALRDKILAMDGLSQADFDYLSNVATLLDQPPAADARSPKEETASSHLELAREAFELGDFDHAVLHARQASGEATAVKILFECAYETQAHTVQKASLQALASLEPQERKKFLDRRRNRELYEQFTGLEFYQDLPIDEMLPSDWNQWLNRLNQRGHWKNALEFVATASSEWDTETFLSRPGTAERLYELLDYPRDGKEEETLIDALPHLLAFLQHDTLWPRRELQKVYHLLLDLLVFNTRGGDDELTMINELAAALLSLGLDEAPYLELLSYARSLWQDYASPGKLDWLLDLLDLVLYFPCPASTQRLNFLLETTARTAPFARRVKKRQLAFLKQLFSELEQQDMFDNMTEKWELKEEDIITLDKNLLDGLEGKSVVIYTLSERVARRVQEILEQWSKNVRVTLNWERGGSDRLKQLARNADIFVMTWASAKHAATRFIQENRPKEMPLLLARGKGSSSIISAIYDYLVEGQS